MSEWIPCTEGMPKEYDSQDYTESKDVLITLCCNSEKYKETEKGFTINGKWYYAPTLRFSNPRTCCLAVPTDDEWQVTAWMPLPEPYEAERREE